MDNPPTVLVADDDASIRIVIEKALKREGMKVVTAKDGAALWRLVEAGNGDVVITDVLMPDENGLDLLPRIHDLRPNLPVIVMSAQNTLTTAVNATEKGAFDYLAKPFDINELTKLVKASSRGADEGIAAEPRSATEDLPLIGRSRPMQELYRRMARVMQTDLTVLITGESGTGKELVARALHQMGPRSGEPFIAVNMAAIPRDLIESELFGHEKGAFTGASQRSEGRFGEAQHGTLFLDEIGDMPFEAQTRLLRVLQEGEYTALGAGRPVKSDVRIIAATNSNLVESVRSRRFREDLFYRLNVVPLMVPALRDRIEDVKELAEYFLTKAQKEGLDQRQLSSQSIDRLKQHSWPGNVRELENLVRRLVVLSPEPVITADTVEDALTEYASVDKNRRQNMGLGKAVETHLKKYFDAHTEELPPSGLYDRILKEVEKPLLALTLNATRGNQIRAAKVLGLNRNTLRKKLQDLGLKPSKSADRT